MCGPTSCVFYSAYNNVAAADGAGLAPTGTTPPVIFGHPTHCHLAAHRRTSTLIWQRDTNNNGLDAQRPDDDPREELRQLRRRQGHLHLLLPQPGDRRLQPREHARPAATVANLRSVRIELVIDANLSHTPTYVDLATTVRPRNAAAFN